MFVTLRDSPCHVPQSVVCGEMADVKAVLLSYQEEGLARTREGEDEEDKEVVVTTRVTNFTDDFLLLKQLRALVRIPKREPDYIMITSYTHPL